MSTESEQSYAEFFYDSLQTIMRDLVDCRQQLDRALNENRRLQSIVAQQQLRDQRKSREIEQCHQALREYQAVRETLLAAHLPQLLPPPRRIRESNRPTTF